MYESGVSRLPSPDQHAPDLMEPRATAQPQCGVVDYLEGRWKGASANHLVQETTLRYIAIMARLQRRLLSSALY